MTPIHEKYQGPHIVAIVKEGDAYHPYGTHTYGNPVSAFSIDGSIQLGIHGAKTIKQKHSTKKTRLLAKLLFLSDLERRQRIYSDYDVLAVYHNVGEAAQQPIIDALDRLDRGEEVDLLRILEE